LCEGVSYHGSLLPAEVTVAPSDEYNVCGYGDSQTFCLHLQLFIRKKGPSGGEEHGQSKLKLLDHGFAWRARGLDPFTDIACHHTNLLGQPLLIIT
jgi:hypothetical protein